MLVKFISFIITVFGTKRYKQPLLFSGLAVVLSLVGITSFVTLYDSAQYSAASTIGQNDEPAGTTPSGSLSKQDLKKQAPAPTETTPTPPADSSTPTTGQDSQSAPNTASGMPQILLSLSEETLTLRKGSTSAPLTIKTTDNSKVQWSVIIKDAPGLSLEKQLDTAAAAEVTFTLKADNNTLTSKQYTVIIQAKDAGRGVDLEKTLLVTIPAE